MTRGFFKEVLHMSNLRTYPFNKVISVKSPSLYGKKPFFLMRDTPRGMYQFFCRVKGRGGMKNDRNVPAIGKVSTHDEGNFLFPELFDGDLKGIGFAL